ncbi:12659_t:CDS:2, partial [Gigaspora rosea]
VGLGTGDIDEVVMIWLALNMFVLLGCGEKWVSCDYGDWDSLFKVEFLQVFYK